MASKTLWTDKQLASRPVVVATTTCEYERVGTQLKIKVNTSNHCTSGGAYWDWRWAFSVSINGTQIANNIQIKPRTYTNTIGTTVYNASTGWVTIDIGTTSEATVSVSFFDTEANNNNKIRSNMGGGTYTINDIPSLPKTVLIQNNKTSNSITLNYSIDGNYDYVRVYVDGNKYNDITSSPFTVTGLESDTTHNIYACAYGSGGFGEKSNTITFNTYKDQVSVSSLRIGNVEAFSLTVYCNSSDASNTSKYEYALCDKNRNVVKGAFESDLSYYNFDGLEEETEYVLRCRVQSKDSEVWSNYVYSDSLETQVDQAQAYFKLYNLQWIKGKIYYKVGGRWKKVKKAYIKVNGQWKLSTNK